MSSNFLNTLYLATCKKRIHVCVKVHTTLMQYMLICYEAKYGD